MQLTRRTACATIATFVIAAIAACSQKQPPPPPPVPLDLSGAVVIGASVSDGFGAMLPGQKPKGPLPIGVPLASTLGAIAHEHPAPRSLSSSLFFMQPEATAGRQADEALAAHPTLVFAIDYLFWQAYGDVPDGDRRTLLAAGLKRLEAFAVPVVIADLPDMRHAEGRMLRPGQTPAPATLEALNADIAAWAAGRKNVVVVLLRQVIADAMASRPLTLGGRTFASDQSRALLTGEGLHATLDGQIAVAPEALDRMKAAGVVPPNAVWEKDAGAVVERLQAGGGSPAPGGTGSTGATRGK